MRTTIDQIKPAIKGNVISYKPCYFTKEIDEYKILRHALYSHDQGTLERKCRIEGIDRIPFVTM
jgi:hypothetical protein